MPHDFESALARVQTDYAFYIDCQSDPESALADYALSPQERAALSDPQRLAEALTRGGELLRPRITVTIKGTHDWVNRAATAADGSAAEEQISREIEAIRNADSDDERGQSTLRLIQLLG